MKSWDKMTELVIVIEEFQNLFNKFFDFEKIKEPNNLSNFFLDTFSKSL